MEIDTIKIEISKIIETETFSEKLKQQVYLQIPKFIIARLLFRTTKFIRSLFNRIN